MLLNVTLDRKTGKVISEELIDSPEVPDYDYFIELLTKEFIKQYGPKSNALGKKLGE